LINIFRENKIFFALLGVLYLVGALFLLNLSRINIHLWFNSFHNSCCDYFFRFYTEVGNGVTIFVISVIIYFFDKKLAYALGLSALLAGLTVQGLKHFVFPDVMRPSAVIDNLYLVKGVVMNKMYSFPSGHTATSFAMFSVLVFYFRKKRLKLLFLGFALLVAYSRIYLSQHFLVDTYFGSIIGVFFAILVFYFFYEKGKE
jgi:membrane-associated phospholipid phosphatase